MNALLGLFIALFAAKPPQISYTLHVQPGDTTAVAVTMHIRNAPDTFTIAAAAHPEYDDKYWRYLTDLPASNAEIVRRDSVLWSVKASSRHVVINYVLRLPALAQRGSWRPFLTSRGGLLGGPHMLLYILGSEQRPASVALDLPPGWKVASGSSITDARTFTASTVDALMDSPILVGDLSDWRFSVRGVPHRVAYWRTNQSATLDTIKFITDIKRFAEASVNLWGMIPYAHYTYLFQDGAGGGLEHRNSVSIGGPEIEDMAHEFFHTWNLMYVQPAGFRALDYKVQPPLSGLWFSEGLTMFYADYLGRKARITVGDSTREAHLANLLTRYYESPGNTRISAEASSRAEYNAPIDALGDYDASPHLQGELIGLALDLTIRNATRNQRSMDDVMRLVEQKFRVFTSRDIEAAAHQVCSCDVAPLFNRVVYNAGDLDLNQYLRYAGLRYTRGDTVSVDSNGELSRDLRVFGSQRGTDPVRLRIWQPDGAWGRAGLHSGDEIVSMNGRPIKTWPEMRRLIGPLKIGDTVNVVVKRDGRDTSTTVRITGYNRPVIHFKVLPNPTPLQLRIRCSMLLD